MFLSRHSARRYEKGDRVVSGRCQKDLSTAVCRSISGHSHRTFAPTKVLISFAARAGADILIYARLGLRVFLTGNGNSAAESRTSLVSQSLSSQWSPEIQRYGLAPL